MLKVCLTVLIVRVSGLLEYVYLASPVSENLSVANPLKLPLGGHLQIELNSILTLLIQAFNATKRSNVALSSVTSVTNIW